MIPHNDQTPAPESGADLKSMPLPELEKKLVSAPDGLSQDEAKKRLSGAMR